MKYYDVPGHISTGEFAKLHGIDSCRISTMVHTGRLKGVRRGIHLFVRLGQKVVVNPNYKKGGQKYLVIEEDTKALESYAEEIYARRSPNRSDAYKVGIRQAIWYHFGLIKDLICPYEKQTAAADAYHAGIAEGQALYRQSDKRTL